MANPSRNRVLGDRLWDADGVEWSLHVRWLDAKQTKQFLGRDQPVALAWYGRPVTWLSAADARTLWQRVRSHFEVPGQSAAPGPDPDGLTYAAKLWRRGAERLLNAGDLLLTGQCVTGVRRLRLLSRHAG